MPPRTDAPHTSESKGGAAKRGCHAPRIEEDRLGFWLTSTSCGTRIETHSWPNLGLKINAYASRGAAHHSKSLVSNDLRFPHNSASERRSGREVREAWWVVRVGPGWRLLNTDALLDEETILDETSRSAGQVGGRLDYPQFTPRGTLLSRIHPVGWIRREAEGFC